MKREKKLLLPTKIDLALNVFLLLAVLTFIGGIFTTIVDRKSPIQKLTDSSADKALHLQERQLAIDEAKKNNQKDYSYSSGFTPGVGFNGSAN